MGKGSERRPSVVSTEVLADRWARTFGPGKMDRMEALARRQEKEQRDWGNYAFDYGDFIAKGKQHAVAQREAQRARQ